MTTPSRHIPAHVRFEVIMRSKGACVLCGTKKGPFEFDHAEVPFSVRPIHEVWNIQILCTECNRKKGANMKSIYVNTGKLWDHQKDGLTALKKFEFESPISKSRRAALVWFATSGGKTCFACCIPFEIGAKKTLILAPGKATARRYAQEWPSIHGNIVIGKCLPSTLPVLSGDSNNADLVLAMSSPIVIMTVPFALNRANDIEAKRIERDYFAEFDTLILDEGHHVAAATWNRVVKACKNARVIYLSGTPKRHDKERLPLVEYTERPVGRGIEYTAVDLAASTGISGARFTRADAYALGLIKKPALVLVESRHTTAASTDGQTRFESESIDDFVKSARDSGHNVRIYDQGKLIAEALSHAKVKFDEFRVKHAHLGRKLTAIVKVRDTSAAERVAAMARQVGWRALPFYSQGISDGRDEDAVPANMAENLRRFESETDDTDMLVQVSALTEGYSNSSICMLAVLCNMESDAEFEQFLGRGLRLLKDVRREDMPEMLIVSLRFGPMARKCQEYVDMTVDLSMVVGPGGPGPGATGEDKPLAIVEEAECFIIGEEWRAEVAKHDKVGDAIRSLGGVYAQNVELFRQAVADGRLALPDNSLGARSPEIPLDHDEAKIEWTRRIKELRSFVFRNSADLVRDMAPEWVKKSVPMCVNTEVYNKRWPGLKGGKSNKNPNYVQLCEFLSCDMEELCLSTLKRFRDWVADERSKRTA